MSNTIPPDWLSGDLSQFCDVVGGGTPDRSETAFWGGDIPWVSPTEVTNRNSKYISETKEHITPLGLERSSAKLHPPGTVLLTSRASIGYAAINTVPMSTNQGFQSLRPARDVMADYLYQYIVWIRPELQKLSAGSTFSEISSSSLKKLRVTLPPLPEQKKIAAILSSVDDVIEKTRAQIDKLNDLKTGMMQELLTKGVGHTNFKDSPVGRIPVGWNIVTLGELAVFNSGYAFRSHELSEDGMKVVRISNLHKPTFPYWRYAGKIKDTWIVDNGDILFSWAGVANSINVHRYMGHRALLNQHIYNFKFESQELKLWTYQVLKSLLPHLKANIEGGAGQLHLTKSFIQSIPIPLPPTEERRTIALSFESVDERISLAQDKEKQFQLLKNSLMQDLLTGKVRVNVSQKETAAA